MSSPDLSDLDAFVAVARARSFRGAAALARRLRLLAQRRAAAAGGAAGRAPAEPHHPQRHPDRGRRAAAGAAGPGAGRDRRRARRRDQRPRQPDRHAAAERADDRRPPHPAADRGPVPCGASRHPAGGDGGGQLRRRAGRRLRCRHPLRGAGRARHDRGAGRPAPPALRHRRRAVLSRGAAAGRFIRRTCWTMPASATASPAAGWPAWSSSATARSSGSAPTAR